jgi:ankyrin repeat protein
MKGTDVEAKNNDELAALQWAAWKGHVALLQLLIKQGSNVNGTESKARTALYYMAWSGHEEVAEMLPDDRADNEAKGDLGNTPDSLQWTRGSGEVAR